MEPSLSLRGTKQSEVTWQSHSLCFEKKKAKGEIASASVGSLAKTKKRGLPKGNPLNAFTRVKSYISRPDPFFAYKQFMEY